MQVLPPSSTGGPSRLFIMRPVATTLLMVAILLAGIIGYRALPVSALPEVDYPTIQVVTLYPGASPDVMTSAVTAPLERQFGQMSGLKQMSSQSSGGASVITLQFQLTLPLDVAEQEVQAAINAATNLLPSDLPNPPVYSNVARRFFLHKNAINFALSEGAKKTHSAQCKNERKECLLMLLLSRITFVESRQADSIFESYITM